MQTIMFALRFCVDWSIICSIVTDIVEYKMFFINFEIMRENITFSSTYTTETCKNSMYTNISKRAADEMLQNARHCEPADAIFA